MPRDHPHTTRNIDSDVPLPAHLPSPEPESGNTASSLIEAPVTPQAGTLKRHEFPDGGGSGGGEAFRRGKRPVPKDPAARRSSAKP